jgi:hypothetical protein
MISPLAQRQILQTLAVETVRVAMEGSAQVQREQAQRQSFNAKLADAMMDVVDVAESDPLKLREHSDGESGGPGGHGTGASADSGEEGEAAEKPPAGPAEPHVDLLA